jgi:lipid II:glycine glycyltransferase (peptidoglycan interpeptide bridge formation enzyme)
MDHERSNILVLDNTNAATTLFHKIFSETEKNRLTITKNKYFYAPSEEYKSHVIRIKNIR